MADDPTIAPPTPDAPPQGLGPQTPPPQPAPSPASKALYDQLSKGQLYTKSYEEFQQQFSKPEAIDQLYHNLNQAKLYTKTKDDFYGQFFQQQSPAAQTPAGTPAQAPSAPGNPQGSAPAPAASVPEHQINHTSLQDIRHLNDLANQPTRVSVSSGGEGAPGVSTPYPEDVARNKAYQTQYDKAVEGQATAWGTDPVATKRAFQDFPTVQNENTLKSYADLAKTNPVNYQRIKDGTDIRQAIVTSGQPGSVQDAQEMNNLFQVGSTASYDDLQHNIATSQELLHKYGLGQEYAEKLKNVYAPLINTLQPGLHIQHWNSPDKDLGLSDFQYAGLETDKMFSPGKYQQEIDILRHSKGLDENPPGQNTPVPVGKKGYAYDRGVENVLYGLENQGRQNTGQYIDQRSVDLGKQIDQLKSQYQSAIHATTDPAEQLRLQAEFNANPLLTEADKLGEGQKDIDYARSEDQMKFPLNFGDQATRLVKDAMSSTNGVAGVVGRQVLLGAGATSANTAGFVKNTFINLLGSEQMKAENATKTIGDQSLTDLSGYEGNAFSTQQAPLVIDPKVVTQIQAIGNNPNLSDEEKNKQANQILLDNPDAVKLNPLAGHQNLTYKSVAYTAANTLGQILGIADQSLLMGGLLGDASKAAKMANAVTPMYASTQNQLYEAALARGDEHPLLSSHLDATIISLASMINPDVKVIKGMVGAETALGKTIAGIDESTWNKVLSQNKPLLDRFVAGTQATAKQLGLAGLQYGVIVPTAQYVVHKNILNEDPNLGDALTDGLQQTLITMALPALLHGVWGGIDATRVNPMQKGAIVEAGLHPKENIELIDNMVQKGQVTPDRADQMRDIIHQTGHILEHTEAVKSDGSWMNEKEVQDLTYQMLRKKVLEGKLKNAPDPQKPAIEAKIAEIDKSVADLHTSEADKQKTELNNLLTSNLDRIREKIQPMETQVLDAIKRNEPEQIFQEIYDQATQTTKFEGRDVSTRPQAEETFGKALVDKAIELHNNKTKTNEKADDASQAGNQGQVAGKPTEGAAPEAPQAGEHAASSFLQSRHADTIHDEQGIVSGPNNKELSPKGRRDANDLAKDVEGKGVTTVITSGLERSKETGQTVADKVGAKVESRPELNTWDIKSFDGLTDEEFKHVQQWFVEHPDEITYHGPDEKYQGKQVGESINEYAKRVLPAMERVEKESGPETLLINHSNNMMMWDAYLKNGREWNDQARQDYLHAEKPEPATLTNQTSQNAIQEPGAGGVLQHPQEGTGVQGGERPGVEPGQQGQAPAGEAGGTGEGQQPPGQAGGGKVAAGGDKERTVGPSHDDMTALALRLGLTEPERGEVLTPQEYAARGRIMIAGGADPEKVARTFERTGNVSPDIISVARAHLENLEAAADKMGDQHGRDSEEYKAALGKLQKWMDDVMKPMGTRAGETFTSLQGRKNMDTGSFSSVARNFYELNGRELTEKQSARIKDLTKTVKELRDENAKLVDEVSKAHDAAAKKQANRKTTFTEQTKKAADGFRKLKGKEFTFKDSDGNDIPFQKMGMAWNDLVELGAKAIEKTGEIADGVAAILDKVKESDWYKGLSTTDKERFGQQLEDHYTNAVDKKTADRIKTLEKRLKDLQDGSTKPEPAPRAKTPRELDLEGQIADIRKEQEPDRKTAARVKALQKELADLQEGVVKSKGAPREKTEEEKDLENSINDLKEQMGLVPSRVKAKPQEKASIPPQQSIAERMFGKKDKTFSAEDARDIWSHLKENYMDKGFSLGDALRGTSADLGLSPEQVLAAIASPKGGKELTTAMWKKQHEQNKASEYARRFVDTGDQSATKKFFNSLPSRFFNLKTYGHGTVGNITHAATNIFRPSVWSAYWPNVFKSFSLAYGSTGNYEKAITLLESSPNFDEWKRAGLTIDPREAYDDYQVFGKKQSWLGEAGTRGFTGLKMMRYDLAELWYNKASESARADPKFREYIAQLANHATGHSEVKVGKVVKALTFAPGLEVSRWQRMITDPIKAADTFIHWKSATPAELAAAKIVAGGAGERLVFYTAALAANAGLLYALGSKQKLNWDDASKSDWLKFKLNDKTLDVTGGVTGPIRLLHTIGMEAYKAYFGDKKDLRVKPNDKDATTLWQQLRYKMAPLPGDILELGTGQDAMGNTVPWSKVTPGKGRKQLTGWDYARDVALPIPIAAGFNAYFDSMDKNDVPAQKTKAIWDGVITGTIEGFAGAKYEPDFSLDEKPAGRGGTRGGGTR